MTAPRPRKKKSLNVSSRVRPVISHDYCTAFHHSDFSPSPEEIFKPRASLEWIGDRFGIERIDAAALEDNLYLYDR